MTKSGAYGTTTRTYKSLEVLFRNEKTDANSWLFSNGINQYCVLGTWRTQWYNYYGVYSTFLGRPFSRSYSGIHVDDSTMSGCKGLYIGSKENGRCSSNDYFHVSGTAAHVGVTGTDTDSIKLRAGAQLRFTLPADGFAATPITTAGGVRVVADADETVQAYSAISSKLVIDPSVFDADRKGRKQTLISCATVSAESLQRLVDNVEFVNAARHGTVTIEDGGTRLVYNGLSGRTMVIVR